ncbi:MAG: nucleotidyltransferase family protein [Bacteroidales bacterium]
MKAMILAAGLGTRLKPITDNKPKALVDLAGKSLLEHSIEKLIDAGVNEIVINVHHFHKMMKEFISNLNYPGIKLHVSDERNRLLDTGGGLWKAKSFFNDGEAFFLVNVDIVSDINLKEFYKEHLQKQALVTLAVSDRASSRCFLWHDKKLCGWRNKVSGEEIISFKTPEKPVEYAFSGIHCISPEIFEAYRADGVFSIKEVYLNLASQHNITYFKHNHENWYDAGTIDSLKKAESLFK